MVSGFLLKSICDGDEIQNVDGAVAVDVWGIFADRICDGDEIQHIHHSDAAYSKRI